MARLLKHNSWFEATCFLCHDFFADPVTIDCGHDFCRACIQYCWKDSEENVVCPRCKRPVVQASLKPNEELTKAVGLVKWMIRDVPDFSEGHKVCKEHQQAVKYFCKDHLVTFCCKCEASKEHLAHNAIPATVAALEYKDRMLEYIEGLYEEKNDIDLHKSDMEKEWLDMIQQIEIEKRNMRAQYEEINLRITEQWNRKLSRMNDIVKEILLNKTKHMAEIAKERSKLDEAIMDLHKTRQQRHLDFLQRVESAMKKCEKEKVAELVPFPSKAKKGIWEIQDFIALLPVAMKQFEAVFKSGILKSSDPDEDFPSHVKPGDSETQAPKET